MMAALYLSCKERLGGESQGEKDEEQQEGWSFGVKLKSLLLLILSSLRVNQYLIVQYILEC